MAINIMNIIFGTIVLIGFLLGIKLMQSPHTALWGNRLGALSMVSGFVYALWQFNLFNEILFWFFILIGAALGGVFAAKVKMIQMPQTVAFFNGSGGAASAVVAGTSALMYTTQVNWVFFMISALAMGIGTLTFFGSIVASGKLQGWISQNEIHIQRHNSMLIALLVIGLILIIISPGYEGLLFNISWPFLLLIFALYGFFMALRIGGADMPVLISFLNSFSGIAAAISGLAIQNVILVGAGALVGVAGLILTGIMCKAMNRSLKQVLSGTKSINNKTTEGLDEEDIVEPVKEDHANTQTPVSSGDKAKTILKETKKIIIIPGYGLAVAQAQHELKNLINYLEENGTEVKLGIHPVAGRMPGHMNVLLAEVGIDHEKLLEMDSINPEFQDIEAVLVVGACDVINPQASTSEDTPISGMPILEAYKAKNVIVLNLDDSPGYSGVPNSLYDQENVVTIWGDAKENLVLLYNLIKE